MSDIFSGLESMGLGGLNDVKIFEEEKKDSSKEGAKAAEHVVTESDFIFDKKIQCPSVTMNSRPKR